MKMRIIFVIAIFVSIKIHAMDQSKKEIALNNIKTWIYVIDDLIKKDDKLIKKVNNPGEDALFSGKAYMALSEQNRKAVINAADKIIANNQDAINAIK